MSSCLCKWFVLQLCKYPNANNDFSLLQIHAKSAFERLFKDNLDYDVCKWRHNIYDVNIENKEPDSGDKEMGLRN